MKGYRDDRIRELEALYPFWQEKTIWVFFEETAERFPDQDFIVSPGERFTYKETKEKVLQVAKGLAAIGVKPGEHVAMQIENCPEQVFVALAVNAIGAVKYHKTFPFCQRIEFVLEQSQSQYLITGCHIDLEKTRQLKLVVTLPQADCHISVSTKEWADFLAAGKGEILSLRRGSEYAHDPSDIIYTSGNTEGTKRCGTYP